VLLRFDSTAQVPAYGAGRVSLAVYPGGHMFYSRPDSRAAFKADPDYPERAPLVAQGVSLRRSAGAPAGAGPASRALLLLAQVPAYGAGRVSLAVYPGGHMFYSRPDSRASRRSGRILEALRGRSRRCRSGVARLHGIRVEPLRCAQAAMRLQRLRDGAPATG
jgi:hypothetical protein